MGPPAPFERAFALVDADDGPASILAGTYKEYSTERRWKLKAMDISVSMFE